MILVLSFAVTNRNFIPNLFPIRDAMDASDLHGNLSSYSLDSKGANEARYCFAPHWYLALLISFLLW